MNMDVVLEDVGKKKFDIDAFLTIDEMELVRTPAEIIAWYREKILNRDPVWIAAVRYRSGLTKQLFSETAYLVRFLEKYSFGTMKPKLKHLLGSQSYDVEIIYLPSASVPKLKYIEITDSAWNEAEALRMQVLHEKGTVPAWTSVQKTGTKNKGQSITVQRIAISEEERLNEIDKVIEALNKKLEKTNNYPVGTGLIVGVDDGRLFKESDEEYIIKKIGNNISPISRFVSIFFVGSNGKLFFEL